MHEPNIWVCLFDIHYPEVDKPTLNAALDFIQRNQKNVAGVYLGGDQLDNAEISHHNANKPLFKPTGSYQRNTAGFDRDVLRPLEQSLPKDALRVWQIGNHDDWENQFVAENPELQGTVERPRLLHLADRGWEVICCGKGYRLGKLLCIHGETLSGFGNQAPGYHARKAVETYGCSTLFGHFHATQVFTKVLPFDSRNKWQGYCSPIVGKVNPMYLRNRPTAWMNGITLVELLPGGNFNVYLITIINGKFSFAGQTYGGKRAKAVGEDLSSAKEVHPRAAKSLD